MPLYAAATSKHKLNGNETEVEKLKKLQSTGAMEKRLIREFESDQGCLNRRGAGGECPNAGSPHFVYVVVRGRL